MAKGIVEKMSESFACIENRTWLNDDVYELECSRPLGFSFLPGQYCSISIDGEHREYTIISSRDERSLRFLIKRVPGGAVSVTLSVVPIGTEIILDRVKGYLVERGVERKRIFIATGTGIAPFVSMLKSGTKAFNLIHGGRTEDDFYYQKEVVCNVENYIQCFSGKQPHHEKQATTYRGYVSEYVHEKLVEGTFDFYLCGTWDMIRDVTHVIDKRFPNANIYSEGFY